MSSVTADVLSWLEAREPRPPAELLAHMRRVVEEQTAADTPRGDITTILAEAALRAFAVAVEHCDDRAAATDLLAADALLTYAMEAAAGTGGDAAAAIARVYGGTRLIELIPEHT
ncbi:MAG TPA: hypothetical protein VF035_09320 [Longimicrobiales bacterium]